MTPTPAQPADRSSSLVRGHTVVTADAWGRFQAGTYHGIYERDVRILSRYDVLVDGVAPTVLQAARRGTDHHDSAFAAGFTPGGDATVVLIRTRQVDGGVRDRYDLRRLVPGPALRLRIEFEADLADVLETKHGAVRPVTPLEPADDLTLAAAGPDGVGVRIAVHGPTPTTVTEGSFEWEVPATTDHWEVEVAIEASPSSGPTSSRNELAPVSDLVVATGDHRWAPAIGSAVADIRGLWLRDGDDGFVAAGAPFFMALFGRDSLLTAYETLPLGTELALGTLDALAARQGRRHDARTLEEPGRILHELRSGSIGVFGLEPGEPYYGTTDATPLFVMLLAEAYRWGADPDRVAALLPAARAAVAWCFDHGDVDDDGFIESIPHSEGIDNQGWKDSGDSMVHADGSFGAGPIALVEVQAYLYGALTGLALLEERLGDAAQVPELRAGAARLASRFRDAYWLEERGILAMGLDASKQPLAVASSNMGHALWTGILDPEVADRVATRLLADDLTCSWGLRTLGSHEQGYSPMAYHRGSVWPHDTAIVAHGLARAGHPVGARALASRLLDAAEASEWRLPELLGGFGRDVVAAPVPYPAACSPQAWSAAAPLLALRAVLGLEPDVPAGTVGLAPALDPWESIEVIGLSLGAETVTLTVTGRREITIDADLPYTVLAPADVVVERP